MSSRLVALLALCIGCGSPSSPPPGPATAGAATATATATATAAATATATATARPYTHQDPVAARALIAAGATVLDVRTPEEFAAGHLPTARNVPLADLEAAIPAMTAQVPRDAAVVVYCEVGGRAAKARQLLERAGYTRVTNGGGYADLR